MPYVALYRKWRPQDFENLVGQEHIRITLKNAITTGRIAHAYLFAGPRGTGKTSTAKIMAKALNCEQGPTAEPCNHCSNCERINTGSSMDVFEIDAASNRGIDEIRELRETVKFAPVDGRYKVYIIDEVHMLTSEAFNALLKTLEEPPAHVVFILATTEAHKIPATIHSRCQRYDFHRISAAEIQARLADVAEHSELTADTEALSLIAEHADGGLRDALSILDQCSVLENECITADTVRQLLGLIGQEWVYRLTAGMAERDARSTLVTLDELIALGKDVRQIMLELSLYIRSLMLYKAAPDEENITMYSQDKAVLSEQSAKFSHDELADIIQTLHEAANEVKWAAEPRITAEIALIAICRRAGSQDIAALMERIAELENKVSALSSGQTIVRQAAKQSAPQLEIDSVRSQSQKRGSIAQPEHVPEKTAENAATIPPGGAKLKEVWAAVLQELIHSGKRSVHACITQGSLIQLDDKQAIVRFTAAFPKERTEKEDYRAIVEKIFMQVYGKAVQLNCILGTEAPKPPSPSAEPKVSPAEKPPEIQHPAVKQALMMFGGKVVQQEENK
ncbi:MAG: DNA polymerase III subunit gamma/tau [Pelosinus sp.]|nr:DNA polymerase III subunit gamma/tau [Pelosinus sp.]